MIVSATILEIFWYSCAQKKPVSVCNSSTSTYSINIYNRDILSFTPLAGELQIDKHVFEMNLSNPFLLSSFLFVGYSVDKGTTC